MKFIAVDANGNGVLDLNDSVVLSDRDGAIERKISVDVFLARQESLQIFEGKVDHLRQISSFKFSAGLETHIGQILKKSRQANYENNVAEALESAFQGRVSSIFEVRSNNNTFSIDPGTLGYFTAPYPTTNRSKNFEEELSSMKAAGEKAGISAQRLSLDRNSLCLALYQGLYESLLKEAKDPQRFIAPNPSLGFSGTFGLGAVRPPPTKTGIYNFDALLKDLFDMEDVAALGGVGEMDLKDRREAILFELYQSIHTKAEKELKVLNGASLDEDLTLLEALAPWLETPPQEEIQRIALEYYNKKITEELGLLAGHGAGALGKSSFENGELYVNGQDLSLLISMAERAGVPEDRMRRDFKNLIEAAHSAEQRIPEEIKKRAEERRRKEVIQGGKNVDEGLKKTGKGDSRGAGQFMDGVEKFFGY